MHDMLLHLGPIVTFQQFLLPYNTDKAKYSSPKENGLDKEDLAGQNVFFKVALGLSAAVAPNATDSKTLSKILLRA